jgi:hypothetical protein
MKTYTITDIDGSNPRQVTLDEFMAIHRANVARVSPIANAFRRGNLKETEATQNRVKSGR